MIGTGRDQVGPRKLEWVLGRRSISGLPIVSSRTVAAGSATVFAGVDVISETRGPLTYLDCAVVAMSADGEFLWKREFAGPFEDRISDLALGKDRLIVLRTHKKQQRTGVYFDSAVDVLDANGRFVWGRKLPDVEAVELATGGGHVIVASARRDVLEFTVESMSLDGTIEWSRTFRGLGAAAIDFDESTNDVIVVGSAPGAVSADKVSIQGAGRRLLVVSLDANDGSVGWYQSVGLRGSFNNCRVVLVNSRIVISGVLTGQLATEKSALNGARAAAFVALNPNSTPEQWDFFVTEDKDVILVKSSAARDGSGFVATVLRLPPILLKPLPVSVIRRYDWVSGGFRQTSRRAFEGRIHDAVLMPDGDAVIGGTFRVRGGQFAIGRLSLE